MIIMLIVYKTLLKFNIFAQNSFWKENEIASSIAYYGSLSLDSYFKISRHVKHIDR